MDHAVVSHDVGFDYLGFVFEQRIQVCLGDFCKRFVGRCKHSEGTFALEFVNQASSTQGCGQGLEIACGDSSVLTASSLNSGAYFERCICVSPFQFFDILICLLIWGNAS